MLLLGGYLKESQKMYGLLKTVIFNIIHGLEKVQELKSN